MIDFAEAGGLWYYGHIHGLTAGDAGVPDGQPPNAGDHYVRKDGGSGKPYFRTKSANNLTRGVPCQYGIQVPRPRTSGFMVCAHTWQDPNGDSVDLPRTACTGNWVRP